MRHPPSLWMRHGKRSTEPLTGQARRDVVVIGGGIAGLSAAWHLGQSGLSVMLLEKHTIGGVSTGRSAGFLAQSSAYDLAELQDLFGETHGLAIYQSILDAIGSLGSAVDTHGIACDMRRGGGMYLAAEPSHRGIIEREHAALSSHGFASTLVEPDRCPVAGVYGALRTPHDMSVDPAALARGLADAMPACVSVHERSPVASVRSRGTVQRVLLANGAEVSADHVVIATGGWALAQNMQTLAVPFTSYIAVTDPLPPEVTAPLGDTILWDTYEVYHYIRRTPDNRLLIGGNDSVRGTLGLERIDHAAQRLMRTLRRMFPGITLRADVAWSGRIALPADGLPVIETRGNRTMLVTDGLLLGWLLGGIAADRITGTASSYDTLYDAGRDMGTAANLLRKLPVPRTLKIHAMRAGLALTLLRSSLDERFFR